jgi:type IV pilus assembly protein PilC
MLLVKISNAFRDYWFLMIIIIFVVVVIIKIWKKTPNGRYIYDNIMLHVPIFGGINKKLTLSKFSRVFS